MLVVSSYTSITPPRLNGAALDERRIATMLASHGFSVTQGVGSNRDALLDALEAFAQTSKECDVSLIYSTGHGLESNRRVFLLPEDYPFYAGCTSPILARHAVPVSHIAAAARGRNLNLVFFAGCRTLVNKSTRRGRIRS